MATALERVLARDRLIVAASLAGIVLLSWVYILRLAGEMAAMDGAMGDVMDMPGVDAGPGMALLPDAASDFVLLSAMWIVMMVGMMLPAAAPTVLLFSALERKRPAQAAIFGRTALFVCGYLLVWGGFSIAAAAAQTALAAAGLMTMDMATTGTLFGGAIFILAGLYEFSPLKDRCLGHCRSPLEWIAHHRHDGAAGALRMGVEHGAYCVGCCWVLMLILFAVGVMNLVWIAGLAVIVLVQKLVPGGPFLSRFAGAALIACGVALIARGLMA